MQMLAIAASSQLVSISVDVKLPFTAEVFLQNMLTCIGYLLMISWVFPHFLIVCIPLLVVFALFVACFRAGIRRFAFSAGYRISI
jgi:hypothetical protein